MPVLENAQHEAFCQHCASGTDQQLAYMQAFPRSSRKAAGPNGARLIARDNVRARVVELQSATATATTLTSIERREMLARVARETEMSARDLATVLLADAQLAGDLINKHEQTVDQSRILSPERRAELIRASMEREGAALRVVASGE
jgi:hypothetical protein